MVAKKKFSAKQLAAQRKFAKIMKSGGFKKKRKSAPGPAKKSTKASPKRRKAQPLKRKTPKRKTVMKRRAAPKKKGFASKIPIINNPTFKKAALGVGSATLAAAAVGLVAPQIAANPIFKPAVAFLTGDVVGVAAQLFAQGGLKGLSLGGSNGNGSNGGNGFA